MTVRKSLFENEACRTVVSMLSPQMNVQPPSEKNFPCPAGSRWEPVGQCGLACWVPSTDLLRLPICSPYCPFSPADTHVGPSWASPYAIWAPSGLAQMGPTWVSAGLNGQYG